VDGEIFSWLRGAFFWAPSWLLDLLMLVAAAAFALALHRGLIRGLRHLAGQDRVFVQRLLTQTKYVTRIGVMAFAVRFTLPATTLADLARERISHVLLVTFIVLIGWGAMVAVGIAADLYLRRFRIDVEDNLLARKHVTQVRILRQTLNVLVIVLTAAAALVTFDSVRQYGVSLLASAGIAGLAIGLAARPVLSNLLAGVQLALTQPIRIDDAVVVENEWGWIEEITGTYVVIKLWDWRRLVVPLVYFIEKPFQNWTRDSANLIGTVFLNVDYTVPVQRVREKLEEIAHASPLCDRKVINLQVTDVKADCVELRVLVSARTSPQAWDLRCEVREKLLAFLQMEYPQALPRQRVVLHDGNAAATQGGARP
jgi:small-conductance mechanosensitive channel